MKRIPVSRSFKLGVLIKGEARFLAMNVRGGSTWDWNTIGPQRDATEKQILARLALIESQTKIVLS